MIKKYVKKPVEVDAILWTGNNLAEVSEFVTDHHRIFPEDGTVDILTFEGVMTASVGDYIIKGIKGEFYPCKPDIFAMTYNEVKEEAGE